MTKEKHRPQLVHEARQSLLARAAKYNDPTNLDWEWKDATNKFERHAINAVLDLEEMRTALRKLIDELRWRVDTDHSDGEDLDGEELEAFEAAEALL